MIWNSRSLSSPAAFTSVRCRGVSWPTFSPASSDIAIRNAVSGVRSSCETVDTSPLFSSSA